MEKRKGFPASSPMGQRDSQYEQEILIIPLCPSLETTAQVEAQSPLKKAALPSKTEIFQKPLNPNSPTSPANGQPSSSIKHLQSLFERDNLPLTAQVTPGKKSSLSSPEEQPTNTLKQLQSLFERESISKIVFATSPPVNAENANCVKDEGQNVPPQLVPVSLSGKTTTSPANGQYNCSLMDEREHISEQTPFAMNIPTPTSTVNGEPVISVKQLQSLFNREQISQSVLISSSNKVKTSLVNGELAFLSRDEIEHVPKVISVTSSNQSTPSMNGDDTSSLEDEGRHVSHLVPVTLSDRPATLPVKGEYADFLKEIRSLNKREQETLLTPLSLSDASPTSTLSVEQVGSSKEIQSPHEGQRSLDLPHSPLAKTELILELKKGKVLRATHQNRGLTTVFSGNSKQNRRVSIERADSTVSSPESDGPQPLSHSQYAPNGHAPPVFPRNSST